MRPPSPGASPPGDALRFRAAWLGFGYLLVVATAWNSLEANPPGWAFIAGDVWLHGATYLVLTFWFGQLYPGRGPQLAVALAFVTLGAFLELLQAWITVYRQYEMSDLGANAGGAALAWLLLRTRGARMLARLDGWLAARRTVY